MNDLWDDSSFDETLQERTPWDECLVGRIPLEQMPLE